MPYDPEKDDPAKVTNRLENLWGESEDKIQQLIENRNNGVFEYLAYFWWCLWNGFPKDK